MSEQELACKIIENGWQQGSVAPSAFFLDDKKKYPDLCMIVSQTCDVVNCNFTKKPLVEIALIEPLKKFEKNSFEARGMNFSVLHIGQNFYPEHEGALLKIHNRLFVDREILTKKKPTFLTEIDERKKIANWISRSYIRVALPDNLVKLSRNFFKTLKKCFESNCDNLNAPFYKSSHSVYIKWCPLDEADDYKVQLLFNMESQIVADKFYKCISDYFNSKDNSRITENADDSLSALVYEEKNSKFFIDIQSADSTTLSDLQGMERFNKWDEFTTSDKKITDDSQAG